VVGVVYVVAMPRSVGGAVGAALHGVTFVLVACVGLRVLSFGVFLMRTMIVVKLVVVRCVKIFLHTICLHLVVHFKSSWGKAN